MRRTEWNYLRDVEQHLVVDPVARNQQVLPDVADALLQRQTVSAHDERGVNRESDQLQTVLEVTTGRYTHLEEFRSENNDTGRSIAHLLVLEVGKLDEHLRRGMLHFKSLQNGRSVVCDRHVADFVHLHAQRKHETTDEHLIQSNGTQRALYDICNGHTRHRYTDEHPHSKAHCFVSERLFRSFFLRPERVTLRSVWFSIGTVVGRLVAEWVGSHSIKYWNDQKMG